MATPGSAMTIAPFAERLSRVRQRFVSSLECKIEDVYVALPKLSGADPDAATLIDEIYQRIHAIVSVGPTVGFVATGRAARAVENLLLPARSAGRGLKTEEFDLLKKALLALREASQQELQSTFSNWR
jgi:chemotaxis protein histidine kinase CheA